MSSTETSVSTPPRPPMAKVVISDHEDKGSVRKCIESCLLAHVGEIVLGTDLKKVSGGKENWHQRLSELRVDFGYIIETNRDRPGVLKPGEYVLRSTDKHVQARRRVTPTTATWNAILSRSNDACEWQDDGQLCGLKSGEKDFIGGGTVKLTADHEAPHSVQPDVDPADPTKWRALCGRHQIVKKNFFDSSTGKINLIAILQSLSKADKQAAFKWLKTSLDVDA